MSGEKKESSGEGGGLIGGILNLFMWGRSKPTPSTKPDSSTSQSSKTVDYLTWSDGVIKSATDLVLMLADTSAANTKVVALMTELETLLAVEHDISSLRAPNDAKVSAVLLTISFGLLRLLETSKIQQELTWALKLLCKILPRPEYDIIQVITSGGLYRWNSEQQRKYRQYRSILIRCQVMIATKLGEALPGGPNDSIISLNPTFALYPRLLAILYWRLPYVGILLRKAIALEVKDESKLWDFSVRPVSIANPSPPGMKSVAARGRVFADPKQPPSMNFNASATSTISNASGSSTLVTVGILDQTLTTSNDSAASSVSSSSGASDTSLEDSSSTSPRNQAGSSNTSTRAPSARSVSLSSNSNVGTTFAGRPHSSSLRSATPPIFELKETIKAAPLLVVTSPREGNTEKSALEPLSKPDEPVKPKEQIKVEEQVTVEEKIKLEDPLESNNTTDKIIEPVVASVADLAVGGVPVSADSPPAFIQPEPEETTIIISPPSYPPIPIDPAAVETNLPVSSITISASSNTISGSSSPVTSRSSPPALTGSPVSADLTIRMNPRSQDIILETQQFLSNYKSGGSLGSNNSSLNPGLLAGPSFSASTTRSDAPSQVIPSGVPNPSEVVAPKSAPKLSSRAAKNQIMTVVKTAGTTVPKMELPKTRLQLTDELMEALIPPKVGEVPFYTKFTPSMGETFGFDPNPAQTILWSSWVKACKKVNNASKSSHGRSKSNTSTSYSGNNSKPGSPSDGSRGGSQSLGSPKQQKSIVLTSAMESLGSRYLLYNWVNFHQTLESLGPEHYPASGTIASPAYFVEQEPRTQWLVWFEKGHSVLFVLFFKEWVQHVSTVLQRTKELNNLDWETIPGYKEMEYALLAILQPMVSLKLSMPLLDVTRPLVKCNPNLLNWLLKYSFNQTNAHNIESVNATFTKLEMWFGELDRNLFKVPDTFDAAHFCAGLSVILEVDHHILTARLLTLLFTYSHLFKDKVRTEIVDFFLINQHFFELFLHWDDVVRNYFHQFIIYKAIRIRRIPTVRHGLITPKEPPKVPTSPPVDPSTLHVNRRTTQNYSPNFSTNNPSAGAYVHMQPSPVAAFTTGVDAEGFLTDPTDVEYLQDMRLFTLLESLVKIVEDQLRPSAPGKPAAPRSYSKSLEIYVPKAIVEYNFYLSRYEEKHMCAKILPMHLLQERKGVSRNGKPGGD